MFLSLLADQLPLLLGLRAQRFGMLDRPSVSSFVPLFETRLPQFLSLRVHVNAWVLLNL